MAEEERKDSPQGHTSTDAGDRPTGPLGAYSPAASALRADEVVVAGRFRIVRFVARGGMGEVYEAEDLDLGARVALKTIRSEAAEDETALARFKQEINLARRIAHPNVCRIYDLGYDDADQGGALAFLTMEFLEGETLRAAIARKGRFSTKAAGPLVVEMAQALGAAHAAKVVHRDFKSANVMLVPRHDGQVRAVVTDFGLACIEGGSTFVTRPGAVLGTLAYMAPEQLEGREATVQSDLYALGVVMYEMVTGQTPFPSAPSVAAAVQRLRMHAPSPRRLVPDLDPRWEHTILRCLEREPGDRFRSAEEVVKALAGEPVAPSPRRRRRRRLIVLGVAAALATAAVAWRVVPRAFPSAAAREPAQRARAPRPVAVLAFENRSGRAEADWLANALAEMLTAELSAGESLRVIPRESVARVKVDPLPTDTAGLSAVPLAQLRSKLGNDLVVLGSYEAPAAGGFRLQVRAQETVTGRMVASVDQTGGEARVLDLVAHLAAELRRQLGVGEVSAAQATAARASRPYSADVARNLGVFLMSQGEVAGAEQMFEQWLAAGRATGNDWSVAGALTNMGWARSERGDLTGARAALLEAQPIQVRLGGKQLRIQILDCLAMVDYLEGDLPSAEARLAEALSIGREIGHRGLTAVVLKDYGRVRAAGGDVVRARTLLEEARGAFQALGHSAALVEVRLHLAALTLDEGRAAEAEVGAREAAEALQAARRPPLEALARALLVRALLAQDKREPARESIARAHTLAQVTGSREVQLTVAIEAARLKAAGGEPTAAARALDEVVAQAAAIGFVAMQMEARLARGEALMATDAEEGRALLGALEKESRARGFGRLARRAVSLRSAGRVARHP